MNSGTGSPDACHYLVRTDRGRNEPCGLPATWQRGVMVYCDAHAQAVSRYARLAQIGGVATLDQRVKRGKVRYYKYPRGGER